jgi:phosphatidate phosphatase APP1
VGLVSKAPRSEEHFEARKPSSGAKESGGSSPDIVDSEGVYEWLSTYRRLRSSPVAGAQLRVTAASGATMVVATNENGYYLVPACGRDSTSYIFSTCQKGNA